MKTRHQISSEESRLMIINDFYTYFVSLIISGLGRDDGTICACSRSRPVRSLSSSGILIGYEKRKYIKIDFFF